MLRECTLQDISDGRIYTLNDMVKADTGSCQGCYKCCTGMGNSIVLDPYDIHLLKINMNKSFEELIGSDFIELNMVDGLILPNLKMRKDDKCAFLDDEGRCDIHIYRPGICRIFPMGRVYDGEDFKYFLQKDECIKTNRTKVKVKKWIDVDNVEENQRFISRWHTFIRCAGDKMTELRNSGKGERLNDIVMYVLNEFFVKDFEKSADESEHDILSDNNIYMSLLVNVETAEMNIRNL